MKPDPPSLLYCFKAIIAYNNVSFIFLTEVLCLSQTSVIFSGMQEHTRSFTKWLRGVIFCRFPQKTDTDENQLCNMLKLGADTEKDIISDPQQKYAFNIYLNVIGIYQFSIVVKRSRL